MKTKRVTLDKSLLFLNGRAPVVSQTGQYLVYGSNGSIGHSDEFNHEQAIILGRVGAYCGSTAISHEPFWASDNTIVVKPIGDQSLRYWYYRLATLPLRSYAGGAAQPLLTHGILKNVEAIIFDEPTEQRRIAEILTAYDDIIGNNRRRMALLEDAARQLYREWFVRLRFPGHEHTRITNGIPEGWERAPFEIALVLQRGFDLPVQNREGGDVPIYGSTGVSGFHNKAKVAGPGVVTGRSGTLGEAHYVPSDFWPLNTALWVKEFKRVSPFFAVFLMREMRLSQYNGGVSVPTLDRKIVHKTEILIPSKRLLNSFDEFAEPLFQQINTLTTQIEKLRAARDLLLPRLMSGEIAV